SRPAPARPASRAAPASTAPSTQSSSRAEPDCVEKPRQSSAESTPSSSSELDTQQHQATPPGARTAPGLVLPDFYGRTRRRKTRPLATLLRRRRAAPLAPRPQDPRH